MLSMSLKSLSIAVAALGFTGLTQPQAASRAAPVPGTVSPAAAAVTLDVAPGTRSVTLTKAPDGLFYVNARVNDAPVRFVVDTGANVTVLTHADAKAAGLSTAGRGRAGATLRTAGGRRAMHWTSIRDLTIGGKSIPAADAVVMAGDGPPHSLLGQSALARFESVTIRGNALELKI